jgi:hypothetical protein
MPTEKQQFCDICKKKLKSAAGSVFCEECIDASQELFDTEMRRIELLRLIRGNDVELYDIKHPDADSEDQHCGQAVLIKAGLGFEVKIWLKTGALDWSKQLDDGQGFQSTDNRLDALIGNMTLLIDSWGGGPHYMDIFYIDKVISIEGDL